MGFVKLGAVLLAVAVILPAQEPVRVPYDCPREDIASFGLTCSEDDPCPVFLELFSVEPSGAAVLAAGDLHTATTTLYSVLLASEDGGKTWTEPQKRMRSTALEQIQFSDAQHGWISGETIDPLPKDPFLLITADAGKTWRQQPLFDETRFGSIAQFWFDSPTSGELVFDRDAGAGPRYERYQTTTAGSSWTSTETSKTEIHLKKTQAREN